MKTFPRMFLVAALASSAAFAFGQTSSGLTPSYALAALESPHPAAVSGSLPDADTLVKIGLNANQAQAVIGIWSQARAAVAPERAQLRALDASSAQPSADATDPAVSTRATLESEINGKLSTYRDQIQTLVGSGEFAKISPFLGHRQMVSNGTWGKDNAPAVDS